MQIDPYFGQDLLSLVMQGGVRETRRFILHKKVGAFFDFEYMPSNIKILEENLRMNPALATKITVIPGASTTGRRYFPTHVFCDVFGGGVSQ